jgi:hypothetical protein
MKIKVPVEFKGEVTIDCPDRLNDYNQLLLVKTFLENTLVDLILSEKEDECPDSYLDQADYSEFPIKIPFLKKKYKNPKSKDWEDLKFVVSKSMWSFGTIKLPKKYSDPGLKDVHTSHCCGEHNVCKYGDESTCTVCQQIAPPEYPCNCDYL